MPGESYFFRIDVSGDKELAQRLGDLYPRIEAAGIDAAAEYINQQINAYERAAPYNYVSWADVGGFVSDAQRRFVMASIAEGTINIPYLRTFGDHYHTEGTGKNKRVVSQDVSMYYSMSDSGQTRAQSLRGWARISELLAAWSPDIVRVFKLAVQDAIDTWNKENPTSTPEQETPEG